MDYNETFCRIPPTGDRITITARDLKDGDIYQDCGYTFRAEDVQYNRPGNIAGTTRTTWTAVWTGTGEDPGPGYRRFGSGGNELRPIYLIPPAR